MHTRGVDNTACVLTPNLLFGLCRKLAATEIRGVVVQGLVLIRMNSNRWWNHEVYRVFRIVVKVLKRSQQAVEEGWERS